MVRCAGAARAECVRWVERRRCICRNGGVVLLFGVLVSRGRSQWRDCRDRGMSSKGGLGVKEA